MSKELEAFAEIENKLLKVEGNTTYGDIHDKVNLDIIKKALQVYNILKRYVHKVSEYPGNELSPYWIIFDGFEGENGDLTKEEYDLLKEVL